LVFIVRSPVAAVAISRDIVAKFAALCGTKAAHRRSITLAFSAAHMCKTGMATEIHRCSPTFLPSVGLTRAEAGYAGLSVWRKLGAGRIPPCAHLPYALQDRGASL